MEKNIIKINKKVGRGEWVKGFKKQTKKGRRFWKLRIINGFGKENQQKIFLKK